jgi:rhodanese-related sulfurtransferase
MTRPALDERGLPAGYPFRPEAEVPAREVAKSLAAGNGPILLDVRTQAEWEAARIPGSVLIPLHELESRLDELDAAKDAPIAVLCHHGARSLRAALMLRALGYTNARSVVGGIDLWSIDVDPAIPRYEQAGGRCVPIPPGL